MWILSYCSFYIRPDASPARISLLVLAILTLITLSNRAFGMFPVVSSPVWVTDYLFCLTMLCCAHLLQFILLHSALRARDRRKKRMLDDFGGCMAAAKGECKACGAHVEVDAVHRPCQAGQGQCRGNGNGNGNGASESQERPLDDDGILGPEEHYDSGWLRRFSRHASRHASRHISNRFGSQRLPTHSPNPHHDCHICGADIELVPVPDPERRRTSLAPPPNSVASAETHSVGDDDRDSEPCATVRIRPLDNGDSDEDARLSSGRQPALRGGQRLRWDSRDSGDPGDSSDGSDDPDAASGASQAPRTKKWRQKLQKCVPRCDAAHRTEYLDFLIEFGCNLDSLARILAVVAFVVVTVVYYAAT